MSTFNVAIVIPRGGNPSVEHSVAVAMEPFRDEQWGWYAIGVPDTTLAGVIDSDRQWHEITGRGDMDDDAVRTFLDTVSVGEDIARVRCHH
jgi:hypothetical protein